MDVLTTKERMEVDPVGIGVVGAGTLGQRLLRHLTLPDVQGSVRVIDVCDPVPGRAEGVARKYGIPRSSLSLEDLLTNRAVDLVTIASPIGLHHEQGLAAIKAGKHVHFNKTMAITSTEATELIEAAGKAGVHLVASPGEMLRPANQKIKELIAEGAIGRLCWAACGAALGTYHEAEPERVDLSSGEPIDPSWYYRSRGGGPLYDMTVYALHGLTGILGSARRVTAMSGVRIAEREFNGRTIQTDVDDNTVMLLDFGESLFAFAYGTASGILTPGTTWDPSVRIYGTKGSIVGYHLNGEPFAYPGRAVAAAEENEWNGNDLLMPHVRGEHRALIEQHVFEDVMQLVDWVRDDIPSPVTAEHARHVLEIIEAAYRAASTGQAQALATTVDGPGPLPAVSKVTDAAATR